MKPNQRIRELMSAVSELNSQSGPHRRDDEWSDADLHIGVLVVEELQGPINGTNRVFTSTFTPVRANPYMMELLVVRGAVSPKGASVDGWSQSGRYWTLVTAPQADGLMTDMRPIAFYQRKPGLVEVEFDAVSMWRRRRDYLESPAMLARRGR